MPESLLPTPAQVQQAKQDCLQERTQLRLMGIHVREDELELGLRLANAMSAAIYGNRGELRKKES